MPTVKLTPAQKAANTRKRNAFLKKIREQQELFRKSPGLLAKAIAEEIRRDEHPNEDPRYYDNGQMHWNQQSWGQFKVVDDPKKLLTPVGPKPDRDWHPQVFEVSCPTTGCIAGWSTTLAGYPMSLKISAEELKEQEVGDVLEINDCLVDGHVRSIVDVAGDLLGIYGYKKAWLFDGYRSQEQVLWALDQIAENGTFNEDNCPFANSDD